MAAARSAKSKSRSAARVDPATAYARAVVAGDIVAGRLVRRACERHLWDLEHQDGLGIIWDVDAVAHILDFFALLRHDDGDNAGRPFALQPFQHFILGSVFGWKLRDGGARRYRTAYVEIGKGNGKTKLLGGVALYGLMADGEPAAEIYQAATQRDQAAILFRDAKQLAESSPAIASRLHITEHNLAYYPTRSFCRAVSKQHRGLDGKRVHYGLLDELHEHPDAQVVNKMRANTKSRRQPIIFEITNSGYDRESVCWRHHQHSVSVLDGFDKSDGLKDESWFAYVCQLDCCEACLAEGKTSPTEGCPRCDDWRDEAVWIKANPGLDVILPRSYLRERVAAALAMPADQSITKRLNFCVWVEAAVHGIPLDKWDACRCDDINEAALEGRTCYLGLDIGAWDDFTALAIAFPDEGEGERVSVPAESPGQDGVTQEIVRRGYTVLFRYWMPEHAVRRDQRMMDVIASWQRAGWITVTPGDVVDYERVRDDIVALSERFGVRLICFDQGFQGIWIGSQLVEHFGAESVYFLRQGMISLNVPFRELLETIVRGQWRHGGDPVTRWMVANCQTVSRGGLTKPSKDHSSEKIDAVLAMTMALAAAIKDASNPDGAIWYSRGSMLDRG